MIALFAVEIPGKCGKAFSGIDVVAVAAVLFEMENRLGAFLARKSIRFDDAIRIKILPQNLCPRFVYKAKF